jgi:hypothetical protein
MDANFYLFYVGALIFTVHMLRMFGQTRLNLVGANCMQIALKKIKCSQTGLISMSPTFLKINLIH